MNGNPARWAPDPSGRYAQRYWDGARWTDRVAGRAGGPGTSDPFPERADTPPPDDASPQASAAARDAEPATAEPTATERPATAMPDAEDELGATGPARWEPDPTGRHAQRYWDGRRWTSFVAPAAGGSARQDPLPLDDPTANSPDEPTPLADLATPTHAVAQPTGAGGLAVGAAIAAGWRLDPSGRFAQRYWDGARWTDQVAGREGGAPRHDPLGPISAGIPLAWKAPGEESDLAAAGRPADVDPIDPGEDIPWRGLAAKLAVAAAIVVLFVGVAAAVLLSGVLHGASASHRARGATPPVASTRVAGAQATVPTTRVAAPTATRDLCGLLTPAQISAVTAIPVGAAQPVANGCAWRGPNPVPAGVSAQDRQDLAGQEGVLLTTHSTPGPSVTCSAQLGVPGSGGICRSAGGEYAMLTIAPSTIVDISLHTARPVTETMLVALAQDAYAHNV